MKSAEPDAMDQIQEEIRQTESEISHTLTSIEARLTPKHIKRELTEQLKHYAVVGAVKISEGCKKRPVPAALFGTAAALLLVRKLTVGRRHNDSPPLKRRSAMVDALPKKVKKQPVKEVKKYVTLGRFAVAAVSALATILARQREAVGMPRQEMPGKPTYRRDLEITVK